MSPNSRNIWQIIQLHKTRPHVNTTLGLYLWSAVFFDCLPPSCRRKWGLTTTYTCPYGNWQKYYIVSSCLQTELWQCTQLMTLPLNGWRHLAHKCTRQQQQQHPSTIQLNSEHRFVSSSICVKTEPRETSGTHYFMDPIPSCHQPVPVSTKLMNALKVRTNSNANPVVAQPHLFFIHQWTPLRGSIYPCVSKLQYPLLCLIQLWLTYLIQTLSLIQLLPWWTR